MERTFVLVKPDGVQRGLIGEIILRLERRGLKLIAAKMMNVPIELAAKHYAAHLGKPFYEGLLSYITASPVIALVWEGEDAVAAVRQTMGSTNPTIAAPGTIRHDLALSISRNLTHASDSIETAEKEIDLWFGPGELCNWTPCIDQWVFGKN